MGHGQWGCKESDATEHACKLSEKTELFFYSLFRNCTTKDVLDEEVIKSYAARKYR